MHTCFFRLCLIGGLIYLASCGNTAGETVPAVKDTATPQVAMLQMNERNAMTDSMLTQIIGYYQKEYANDSVVMETDRSDTLVELGFRDTAAGPDDYQGRLFVAYISLVQKDNPVLSGDMDGDGRNDMLVSVHTEGGGGGGNIWWSDHFLFLAGTGGAYRLTDVKSDGEIMEGSGYFFPKTISGRQIMGIGNAYADTDGHCCPSLYYRMQLVFHHGQLATSSKTSIPQPEGF